MAGVSARARSAAGRTAVPSLSRLIWPQRGRRQLVTGTPGAGRQMGSEATPPFSTLRTAPRPRSGSGRSRVPRLLPVPPRRVGLDEPCWGPEAASVTPHCRIFSLPPLPREYVRDETQQMKPSGEPNPNVCPTPQPVAPGSIKKKTRASTVTASVHHVPGVGANATRQATEAKVAQIEKLQATYYLHRKY